MKKRIQSIKSFVFIGGIIPTICLSLFIILEPHLLRIICVLLSGYLAIFLVLVFLMLKNQFTLETISVFNNLSVFLCCMLIIFIVVELTFYYKYKDVSIGAGDSPSGVTFYPKYYKENRLGFRDRNFNLKPSEHRCKCRDPDSGPLKTTTRQEEM